MSRFIPIREESCRHRGQNFKYAIRYDTEKNLFRIDLPAVIVKRTHKKFVTGQTEARVRNEANEWIAKYITLGSKPDKVILYEYEADLHKEDHKHIEHDDLDSMSGRHVVAGVEINYTGVRFRYQVALRFRTAEGRWDYTTMKGAPIWMGGEKVMKWTPEREQFFWSMRHEFGQLVSRLHNFFNQRPGTFAKQIDVGLARRLLKGPEKQEKI
jgi:hypothetical protein